MTITDEKKSGKRIKIHRTVLCIQGGVSVAVQVEPLIARVESGGYGQAAGSDSQSGRAVRESVGNLCGSCPCCAGGVGNAPSVGDADLLAVASVGIYMNKIKGLREIS